MATWPAHADWLRESGRLTETLSAPVSIGRRTSRNSVLVTVSFMCLRSGTRNAFLIFLCRREGPLGGTPETSVSSTPCWQLFVCAGPSKKHTSESHVSRKERNGRGKLNIGVSASLLGQNVRYNGGRQLKFYPRDPALGRQEDAPRLVTSRSSVDPTRTGAGLGRGQSAAARTRGSLRLLAPSQEHYPIDGAVPRQYACIRRRSLQPIGPFLAEPCRFAPPQRSIATSSCISSAISSRSFHLMKSRKCWR